MFLSNYGSNYFLLMSELDSMIKKTVTFSSVVYLRLIPTRREIVEENLFDELWWSEKDFIQFRIETFDEMNELKQKHPNITRQEVLKLLYQPGNICYDKNNF